MLNRNYDDDVNDYDDENDVDGVDDDDHRRWKKYLDHEQNVYYDEYVCQIDFEEDFYRFLRLFEAKNKIFDHSI